MQFKVLPSGFTLRPARLLDAESIARVHVQSWKETYRGIMDQAYLEARTAENRTEIWKFALSALPKDRVFIVLEDKNGEIGGFAYGGPARDETIGRSGELYAMYLLKRLQGSGLGRALFNEFQAQMRSVGRPDFYALILEGNPSRGFFEKMEGFFCGFGSVMRTGRRGGRRLAEERWEWR